MPKTGIIFKVEEFRITPSIQQCFKCQGFGHKAQNCTKKQKCVACGEAHSHKSCPNKDKKPQNVQTVGDLMSPITEAVLRTRIKRLGNMWSKIKFLIPPLYNKLHHHPPTTDLILPPNKLFPW